jgi:hypothetical protein
MWEYDHNYSIADSEKGVLKNEILLMEKKLTDCENLIRQMDADSKEKESN